MRLPGSLPAADVDVRSVVAARGSELLPMVALEITLRDEHALVNLYPAEARRIGLDLLSAAVAAIHDTGLRRAARNLGADGDGLTDAVRLETAKVFQAEGEPR